MKRTLILGLMMAAAVAFTGCSKDNDNNGAEPAEGKKATLSVAVDAPVMGNGSRAVGTAVPTDAVGNFSVFITDKTTGDIKWKAYSAAGANLTGANAIATTTNAEHVYVVANAGDLTSSITNLAGLKAYVADLNGTGSQAAAANRWATGQTATALTFSQSGADYLASTTVSLTFIAARITVKIDNQMTNQSAPGAVSLTDMAVINARGESRLFPATGTSLIPASYTAGKKFYTGLANPAAPNNFAIFPATTDYTLATTLLSDNISATPTDTYYYYVFENDAITDATFPTIVTLVGTDGTDTYYWPVHLAPYEKWTAGSGTVSGITRGNTYDISIKLTGDAAAGGNGTDDPTKPLISSKVEISVTLNPWTPVVLGKEF